MAVAPTLVAVAVVHLVTAASFAIVANTVAARSPPGEPRDAARGFALWWLGLGAYLFIEGTVALTAAFGPMPLGVYLATRTLTVPLLVGATWGLVYYLTYLYTGRSELRRPLAWFYAAVCALFYYAVVNQPHVVDVGQWLVRLEGTGQGWAYRVVYFAVGLPAIFGSLAYAALVPRLRERAQRFRVALVSSSILAWVASGLVAQLGTSDPLKFVTIVPVGLAAALLVLLAYHPPERVQRWLATGPAREASGAPAPPSPRDRAREPS